MAYPYYRGHFDQGIYLSFIIGLVRRQIDDVAYFDCISWIKDFFSADQRLRDPSPGSRLVYYPVVSI